MGLNKDGSIKGVEVLTYRESYGHQIRNVKWRAQLRGKTHSSPVKIDKDVKNISGATLSCVHIVDGARRMLHTWQQVLSKI
ncbi:FMN-binding protein [Rubritalea sp.]|uniref:FMN-binding protein n=1 Tax=Rubritalea sp. TaxID=2109375 RepID=UPI003241EA51